MKHKLRLQDKLDQTVKINGYKPFNTIIERVYISDCGFMSGSITKNTIAERKQRIHLICENGVWIENRELNKAVKFVKQA